MALSIIEKRLMRYISSNSTFNFAKGLYCRNRENTAEDIFIPEMTHHNIHEMAQILNKKGFNTRLYEKSDYDKTSAPFRPNQMLTMIITKQT
jgi:hypothetical protein